MSRAGRPASAIGRAAAAVRQHFADPTFYARRYRASVGARDAPPQQRRTATGGGVLRLLTWWLPRPRREGAPSKAQPDAFDRWMARPAVFLPATLIGLAVIVATLDVPRGSSLFRSLPVMAGVLAAWLGVTGALSYVERRWPQTEPVLSAGTGLFSIALVLCSMRLSSRAVSVMLMQLGLWTFMSLAVAWWKDRPGKGEG